MRILMLTWHYPPAVGGSERMAERLVAALAPRGHRIEIWTARRSDAPAVEFPASNLVIRRCLFGVPFGPLFGATAFLQAAWSLWRARGRFDVIHSHQASWSSLGGVLARIAGGIPILVMVASSGPLNDVRRMKARKGGRLLVRLLRRADAFIALCRSAREEMVECGIERDKIRIVHNGLDLGLFGELDLGPFGEGDAPLSNLHSQISNPLPSEGGGPSLVYVGRLHPIKGVDVLLRAFARVAHERPGARLTIVGDGEARPDLEALAAELGLAANDHSASPPHDASLRGPSAARPRVVFAGVHTDPRPFYRQSDMVILPSRTEGMSNVMIEAMASARPIVATAVGGNCDLLDPDDRRAGQTGPTAAEEVARTVFFGENGVLVPPESPEALASGILALAAEPARARVMADSARRYAVAHCAIEAVADRYEVLYRELTK